VHIPVVISKTGLEECVYNDFHIGEGADVLIVAGCGIHNSGDKLSRHDGIHTFYIGKNARVKYVEKHYGKGDGNGENVMNPTTIVNIEETRQQQHVLKLTWMVTVQVPMLFPVLWQGIIQNRFFIL